MKDGVYVAPKDFLENKDSLIPSGKWSFWFNKPVKMSGWCYAVVVEAEFEPELEGVMTFSQDHRDYDGKIYLTEYFQVAEYVTSQTVKINKIWMDEDDIKGEDMLISCNTPILDIYDLDYLESISESIKK